MKKRKWFIYRKQSAGETLGILVLSLLFVPLGGILLSIAVSIVLSVILNWWKSADEENGRVFINRQNV